MAYTTDLKSVGFTAVRVRLPLRPLKTTGVEGSIIFLNERSEFRKMSSPDEIGT